jgi:hypothetical protein
VFTKPQGPDLTADQVRELNDDFFTAQPFEFFASRIASLITSSNADTAAMTGTLGSDISAMLGIAGPAEILRAGRSVRKIQLAVDSLAVRHHAAEALVRLYYALAFDPRNDGGKATRPSVWTAIANSPRQTVVLVREARNHLSVIRGQRRSRDWSGRPANLPTLLRPQRR